MTIPTPFRGPARISARAYALRPDDAAALKQALSQLEDPTKSVGDLAHTIHRLGLKYPDHAGLHYAAALSRLRAYALAEGDVDLRTGLGQLWLADADEHLQAVLDTYGHAATYWYNLGCVRLAQGNKEDARRFFTHACEIDPQHGPSWLNLGHTCLAMNAVQDAWMAWSMALSLPSPDPLVTYDTAYALMIMGRWREAFAAYETRRRLDKYRDHFARCEAWGTKPWAGEPVPRGSTIIVAHEQGLGDAVQCARWARALQSAFDHVVFEVPKPAVRLLRRWLTCEVIAVGETPPPAEYHVPAMSLPYVLGAGAKDLWTGYISPALQYGRQNRVGLVWAGSRSHANDAARSMPAYYAQRLAHHCRYLHVEPVALQMDRPDEEYGRLARPTFADLADTADAIASCDLVISVDTSVVHVAASMGVPVFMATAIPPDSRWGISSEKTPWYPRLHLIRQPAPGDWDSVIVEIERRLSVWFTS